jgi:hypothetical protein
MRELNPKSDLMAKFLEADEIIEEINMRLGQLHAEYEDLMMKRENLKVAKVNLREKICGIAKLPEKVQQSINVAAQAAPARAAPARAAPARAAPARQTEPAYDFLNMSQGREKASHLQFNNSGGSVVNLPPLAENGIAPVDGLTHEEILMASRSIREQKLKAGQPVQPLPDIPISEAASEVPNRALEQLKKVTDRTVAI